MKKMYILFLILFSAALFSLEANGQTTVSDTTAAGIKSEQPRPMGDKPAPIPYTNPDRIKSVPPSEMQMQDGKKERVPPAGVPTFQTIPDDKKPEGGMSGFYPASRANIRCEIERVLC